MWLQGECDVLQLDVAKSKWARTFAYQIVRKTTNILYCFVHFIGTFDCHSDRLPLQSSFGDSDAIYIGALPIFSLPSKDIT
mmetsp:Transcript_18008/g.25238  ORF Transcript_18008/g.25238 Transcript_18008/m.25238 type:complete len:81 (-) Transcript_18008:1023-1265(-)